jgi:hypothetical protein
MMNFKPTGLLIGLAIGFAAFCGYAQTNAATSTATNAAQNAVAAKPVRHDIGGKLGDPAPKLTVREWIKGTPFQIKPGTNVYVLVFCTLSRANEFALTNLSALQNKYRDKGVLVAAICSDAPQDIKDFITTHGGEINFSVATDDFAQKTANDYQRFFAQRLLPRAYVVGTNATALWHGHPLRDDMGMIVDKVTSGHYDPEQTQRGIEGKEQMEAYLAMARQDDPRTPRIGRYMLIARTNDAPALCDMAFEIATDPYIGKRDVALASLALDRAEEISKTNATDIVIMRSLLLFQSGLQQEGLAKARAALAAATNELDKNVLSRNIRAMEKLMALKTNKVSSASEPVSGTNAAPRQP